MNAITCLCGQLTVQPGRPPDFVHECNCTLCRKTGARWAYYHPDEVKVSGKSEGYSRADKEEPAADIRFCATCGTTTHFVLTESAAARHGNTMMGVNMRLAADGDLAGVELRFPDGAAWDGASQFAYVEDAIILK